MTTSLTKTLKGNVRHLLSVRDRPTQKAGPKWTHTVYYAVTTELRRSGVSESMARRTDSACMLVKVCDKSGREVDRLPEALVTPLRSARGATAEKKAQAFFRALKQRGQVALVEVEAPVEAKPEVEAPKAQAVPVVSAAEAAAKEAEEEEAHEAAMGGGEVGGSGLDSWEDAGW